MICSVSFIKGLLLRSMLQREQDDVASGCQAVSETPRLPTLVAVSIHTSCEACCNDIDKSSLRFAVGKCWVLGTTSQCKFGQTDKLLPIVDIHTWALALLVRRLNRSSLHVLPDCWHYAHSQEKHRSDMTSCRCASACDLVFAVVRCQNPLERSLLLLVTNALKHDNIEDRSSEEEKR